ncbi:hotdog fold thioesterase [Rhodococcus sp. NPDC057014]|uniref:hotdog fold thioesterase n=1 Tax=unclassified Rhodococcus (in: high G+C Gram-positive bacteria) TaxID=192944 RepID=UPI00363DBE7E
MNIDSAMTPLPDEVALALMAGDRCAQSHGIECREIDEGFAVMAMTVREDMANTLGICHGGIIFLLADTALAYAASASNQASVTTTANISYPAAARTGDNLLAECWVSHQAGRAGIYDVVVRRDDGQLVAVFRGNTLRTGAQILPAD